MIGTNLLKLVVAILLGGMSCKSSMAQAPERPRILRFQGSYTGYVEQPVGTPDCGAKSLTDAKTSGYLALSTATARTIREDATGCRIRLQEIGPSSWSGANEICQFEGAVTLKDIGVTSLSYDAYSLDLGAGTLSWRGRMIRDSQKGPVSFCVEVKATVAEQARGASGAAD